MNENTDLKQRLSRENHQFRKLVDRHQELDGKIQEMDRRRTLTPREEVHLKQLRVEKLHAKDQIEKMIREQVRQGST